MFSIIKPCMIISSVAILPDKRYFCECLQEFLPSHLAKCGGRKAKFPILQWSNTTILLARFLRDRPTRACQHTVISLLVKGQGMREEETQVRENLLRIEIHPLGSHSVSSRMLILHKLNPMIFLFPSWYMETKSKSMGSKDPRLWFVSRLWYWIWTLPGLNSVEKQDLWGTKSALVPQGVVSTFNLEPEMPFI